MKLENLRDLRKDFGYTQEQIATHLNISQRAYSHYENGTREIPLDLLIKVCQLYEVSLDFMVGLEKRKRN